MKFLPYKNRRAIGGLIMPEIEGERGEMKKIYLL